jgi:dTDP-4-dehydrorhamnose reductase
MFENFVFQVAVSGSNGQLGREIARIANDHPRFHFIFLTKLEFPLDDAGKMKSWLDVHKIHFFINCAAYTAVDKAESDSEKAFEINAQAPGYIAGLLAEKKIPLIQLSTDYVFDGLSSQPLTEIAATHPVNIYGASKLEGEKRIIQNNPLSIIIRTSWLYSEYGNNFVKTMMNLLRTKESIQVVDDQKGSPTYAGDLAAAIIRIMEWDYFKSGIYHYSNEGEVTWYEFALEIKKLTDSSCEVLPVPSSGYPKPAKRPSYSLMDKSKIKTDYGLTIPDWKTSLAVCIELLKKQEV